MGIDIKKHISEVDYNAVEAIYNQYKKISEVYLSIYETSIDITITDITIPEEEKELKRYVENLTGEKLLHLNRRMIIKIENYFKEKYNIDFYTYPIPERTAKLLHINLLVPLENILGYILEKAKFDFQEFAHTLIKKGIRDLVAYTKQPLCFNTAISLYNVLDLDRGGLKPDIRRLNYTNSRNNRFFKALSDAITLYETKQTLRNSEIIKELYRFDEVNIKEFYYLQPIIIPRIKTIKIMVSGSVKLTFYNEEDTKEFWETFIQ